MKHAHIFPALLFGAALMSGSASGNETPGATMIISAETVCAQQPNSDFCRQQPAGASYDVSDGTRYGTAVPPYPVPATGKAIARQPMPHGASIQALETRAPWMDGYVRWCDAFPQHGNCQ
jgi:hypothetical protein